MGYAALDYDGGVSRNLAPGCCDFWTSGIKILPFSVAGGNDNSQIFQLLRQRLIHHRNRAHPSLQLSGWSPNFSPLCLQVSHLESISPHSFCQ